MATLIPVLQSSNVEAAYEDMFKEITRKLYGEETGNGLHTLGTPVAQIATSGPTAPEGERSFTTLMSDRNITEYESQSINVAAPVISQNFKTEDSLTAAFGLAALMQQNGFTTTLNSQNLNLNKTSGIISNSNSGVSGNNLTVNTTNTSNPSVSANDQQRWIANTVNSSATDVIVQWPTNCKLSAFTEGNQKSIKTLKHREQSMPIEICNNSTSETNATNQSLQQEHRQSINNLSGNTRKRKRSPSLNSINITNNTPTQQIPFQKRYTCTFCPYSTDRRDLYTRHENIHKDEKPFQCYACLKQFNRADHVKKHFLRMHREIVYDINKTRRNISNGNNQQQQQTNVDQKPIIFGQQNQSEAFVSQRIPMQETSSSLSIEQTIESVATAISEPVQMKQEKNSIDDKSTVTTKIKREKRFTCCYCSWSGADKWGLKRHLNTHTKPFVCILCDYKAARSERLATHVLKVHNKKACSKCSYLADTQEEFQLHLNEVHSNNSNNIASNIPLQEIIVSPTSIVGWRLLSANGSLIPPHDATGILTVGSVNQKRGAERLFQYLEAEGSDPEDYTRQLKMDAISRNTASVAQDFHNAGGVNLKSKQPIFKSTSKFSEEAELLLLNNSKFVQTTSIKNNKKILPLDNDKSELCAYSERDKKKAMSEFLRNLQLEENISKREVTKVQTDQQNQQPLYKSPPAKPCKQNNNKITNNYNVNRLTNSNRKRYKTNIVSRRHRLNLKSPHNKENSHEILTINNNEQISSQINSQFQNYVKEIINKYYATETALVPLKLSTQSLSLLHPPPKNQKNLSETERYIEYLKNKEDITITITPKLKKKEQISKPIELLEPITIIKSTSSHTQPVQLPTNPNIINKVSRIYEHNKNDRSSRNRKQSQPKKIRPAKIVMAVLRDKYMKKLVERKFSCIKCLNSGKLSMLVFPYYTKGSLALHRMWKHSNHKAIKCKLCRKKFFKRYSLEVHNRITHF